MHVLTQHVNTEQKRGTNSTSIIQIKSAFMVGIGISSKNNI